jgi:hypothetical protein
MKENRFYNQIAYVFYFMKILKYKSVTNNFEKTIKWNI